VAFAASGTCRLSRNDRLKLEDFHKLTLAPSAVETYYRKIRVDHTLREPSSSSQYSVWLRAGRPGDRGSIPGRGKRIFPVAYVSRPAVGPAQSPLQWVPGGSFPGVKRGLGVTLTTHLI
jgi:hypothetical protein